MAMEIPPDTVTAWGSRVMETRPDVNVSIEVGTEWSWVVIVVVVLELDDAEGVCQLY